MRRFLNVSCALALMVGVTVLAGCSTIDGMLPGDKTPYKHTATTKPLDMPPGLSSSELGDSMVVPGAESSGTATYSEYERSGKAVPRTGAAPVAVQPQVLPPQKGIKVVRDGDRQWLVVDGTPDQVWPKVRAFWLRHGFELASADPSVGIMETKWVRRSPHVSEGPIQTFLTKYLGQTYGTPTRERFRVRLERGLQSGTTDVYLTHQGVEQVTTGGTVGAQELVWAPQPPDPGLDAEMIRRLMIYLGVDKARAAELAANPQVQPSEATLRKDSQGRTVLVVNEGYSRAWSSAGIVLDRVGFLVQDQDRSKGIYYVRYDNPLKGRKRSWLSKLAFWSDASASSGGRYRIQLTPQGGKTEVTVLDKSGARDDSAAARHILKLMYEQFK